MPDLDNTVDALTDEAMEDALRQDVNALEAAFVMYRALGRLMDVGQGLVAMGQQRRQLRESTQALYTEWEELVAQVNAVKAELLSMTAQADQQRKALEEECALRRATLLDADHALAVQREVEHDERVERYAAEISGLLQTRDEVITATQVAREELRGLQTEIEALRARVGSL